MTDDEYAVCPDCGGDIVFPFPFGSYECADCGRPFTLGDERRAKKVDDAR